jgi:hypothetical protein
VARRFMADSHCPAAGHGLATSRRDQLVRPEA